VEGDAPVMYQRPSLMPTGIAMAARGDAAHEVHRPDLGVDDKGRLVAGARSPEWGTMVQACRRMFGRCPSTL
jgi:hypothetical protein